MPSKALLAMAGLNRKVLNSRRITKLVAPSNPVFSRSFITSFGVAFYIRGAECWFVQPSAPFLFWQDLSRGHSSSPNAIPSSWSTFFLMTSEKKTPLLAWLRKKQYICTAKQKQFQDNEGLFI